MEEVYRSQQEMVSLGYDLKKLKYMFHFNILGKQPDTLKGESSEQ